VPGFNNLLKEYDEGGLMKHEFAFLKWMMILSLIFMVIGMDRGVFAQEMGKVKQMMGFDRPPEFVKMMQEPNKVLSNGAIQYLTIFNTLLHIQASQRPDQIDPGFIKVAFGEIKRGYEMAEKFQVEHVKTMDADMKEKVKMMMARMNKNLSGIKDEIALLEKEITTGKALNAIITRTGKIAEYLNDLGMMRSGMAERPMMPGGAVMPGEKR
jgi:hypothetical protein